MGIIVTQRRIFITVWNPSSKEATNTENKSANAELKKELTKRFKYNQWL
ncbi:DUF3293 domain-containing protein [uncultured Psychrobacter sp.]